MGTIRALGLIALAGGAENNWESEAKHNQARQLMAPPESTSSRNDRPGWAMPSATLALLSAVQGRVETQGLLVIAPRLVGAAQGGEGEGAIVEAARRLGRRSDADAEGRDRVGVAALA